MNKMSERGAEQQGGNAENNNGPNQHQHQNNNNQQQQGNQSNHRNNNQGQYRRKNNGRQHVRHNTQNTFKGDTPGMGSNVFQIHSEQKTRGQFQDTLEALKVYSSTTFRKEITSLTRLFTELKAPELDIPKEPVGTKIKNESGKYIIEISRFDETVYNEEVKQWIKDNKILKATIQSLYNIVWGQCSRLMKNKLKTVKDFQNMENSGNVTTLLKEIRAISHQLEASTSIYDYLHEAKRKFYLYKQNDEDSNAKHRRSKILEGTFSMIRHSFKSRMTRTEGHNQNHTMNRLSGRK